MRTVSFEHNLAPDNMARVRFKKEEGIIRSFVVQLECRFDEQWHAVVRYDTAHDIAHCDIIRPDGSTEKTMLPVSDYNEALTFAYEDIKSNWRFYRKRYQEWNE